MLSLLMLACTATPGKSIEPDPCTRKLVSPEATEPPVEQAGVWAALSAFNPVEVVWSEAPDGAVSATVNLSIESVDGDAMTVVYGAEPGHEDTCEARTGLNVPVLVTTVVGDLMARQSTRLALEAFGPDLSEIEVYYSGTLTDDLLAEVNEDWFSQCFVADAEEWRGTLTDVWLTIDGPLDSLVLGLKAGLESSEDRTIGGCWSGLVSIESE